MAHTKAQPTELTMDSKSVTKLFLASRDALRANRPLHQTAASSTEAARSLTQGELSALNKVGLSTQPWVGSITKDPLARTIVDYMALVDTSLTTHEVARLLDVDVSRVRQRIRGRSLFALEYEGEWRLPRFQFERHRVLPGLAEVLQALAEDLSPLDVVTWFLTPNVDLNADEEEPLAMSPRAWLLAGEKPSVLAHLARNL